MTVPSGLLRERITLQQRVAGVDALGQALANWADVATVWAQALPIRGREWFAAGQTQAEVSVRFVLRYRTGVDASMRVLWRNQAHDIVSVIDVGGMRADLELMCLAGVKDGR